MPFGEALTVLEQAGREKGGCRTAGTDGPPGLGREGCACHLNPGRRGKVASSTPAAGWRQGASCLPALGPMLEVLLRLETWKRLCWRTDEDD